MSIFSSPIANDAPLTGRSGQDSPTAGARRDNLSARSTGGQSNKTSVNLRPLDFHHMEPIPAGFLLKYCDAHYCSESIRFLTAVDRFRDYFHSDKSCNWPSVTTDLGWRALDAENHKVPADNTSEEFDLQVDFVRPLHSANFITAEQWPSNCVNREAIRECLVDIWDTYLAENSAFWICMPSWTLANTIKRMQLVHLYGPATFEEALRDPEKTIQKDIYPRFIHSEEYKQWKRCESSLVPLPAINKLRLPKPASVILTRYSLRELEKGEVQFTLKDLLEDRTLYMEFGRYLEQSVALENLYSMRAIALFKEVFNNDKTVAFDVAWTIYKFFIAPSSAFEISLNFENRREIMRDLAAPKIAMFDAVEQSALIQLRTHFQRYETTKEYANLPALVVEKHKHNSGTEHSAYYHPRSSQMHNNNSNSATNLNNFKYHPSGNSPALVPFISDNNDSVHHNLASNGPRAANKSNARNDKDAGREPGSSKKNPVRVPCFPPLV